MDGHTARQMGPLWDKAALCCVANFQQLNSHLYLIFKNQFPLKKNKEQQNPHKIQNQIVY